jgi:hypothetical protein
MTKQEYMDMYHVVGAAMEVHTILGHGMAEPIYQEALAVEMEKRGMMAEREKELKLKSVEEILPLHRAQLFNYMRITGTNRGILFNFGEDSLYTERYLYQPQYDEFVMLNHDNYMDYITPKNN